MRFDDRLATVLAQPETDPLALRIKWHQVADLLAQTSEPGHSPQVREAIAFLQEHEDKVDPADRERIAAYVGRALPPHLSTMFAARKPVAPPMNPTAEKAEIHIRDLVARLDAFRKDREGQGAEPASSSGFRWETGVEGSICWVDGVHRGPLIGQTIAAPASANAAGADNLVADCFRRRAPFRDGRFRVAGSGPASGEWLISGVPFFDARQDHFLGYRGSARRPRAEEKALGELPAATGLFGTDLPPDSLRQLIHEIRTPLNAIVGFAEMIDGQYMGPAADGYRVRAAAIRTEAARLLAAVDDLDTAARIQTSRFPVEETLVDLQSLLTRVHHEYRQVAKSRGASLDLDFAPGLPPARVPAESAERMIARMLAATLGLALQDEILSARMTLEKDDAGNLLCLAIGRPKAIHGKQEAELLDPGFTPEGEWPEAPTLGLGFALRLVRNLAETMGGSLTIAPERFLLYLPAAVSSTSRQR